MGHIELIESPKGNALSNPDKEKEFKYGRIELRKKKKEKKSCDNHF